MRTAEQPRMRNKRRAPLIQFSNKNRISQEVSSPNWLFLLKKRDQNLYAFLQNLRVTFRKNKTQELRIQYHEPRYSEQKICGSQNLRTSPCFTKHDALRWKVFLQYITSRLNFFRSWNFVRLQVKIAICLQVFLSTSISWTQMAPSAKIQYLLSLSNKVRKFHIKTMSGTYTSREHTSLTAILKSLVLRVTKSRELQLSRDT